MIKKLGNSDWVRQGLNYHEENQGMCPFCQQKTTKDFEKSLIEYFDESFSRDSAAVNKFASDYNIDALCLQQQGKNLIDMQSKFLDTESIKSEKLMLTSDFYVANRKTDISCNKYCNFLVCAV